MGSARRGRLPWGLLPLALLVLVVGALPFFTALRDSFYHDLYGARSYAGFDNYRFLLGDKAFFLSGGITLAWATLEAILATGLGWGLALLLYESKRTGGLVYAALLVPWAVPAFIAVPLWRMLIHGAGGESVLSALFGLRVNLLTDPGGGFVSALLVGAWMNAPGAVFVLYGALRKLPRAVIEAARLDGAGSAALSRLLYAPLVRSSVIAVFALEFVKAFKEFQVPFLLTAGGPPMIAGITERAVVGATTTLEIYLYDLFQGAEDYGLAAAYAAVAGAFVVLLTLLAFLTGRYAAKQAARQEVAGSKRSGPPRPGRFSARNRAPARVEDGLALVWRRFLGAVIVLSAALLVFALVRTAISGLSSTYVASIMPPFPTLDNFPAVFREDGAGRAFANTLAVSLVTAAIAPLLVLPAALRLRRSGPGLRAAVFAALQALGSAGGMHSLVPLYALFRGIGLVDSYVPVVIVYLFHAAPFALFTTTAFLESLPPSLEESAALEGAGPWQTLSRIVLPLCLPVLATSAMTAFLAAWNGFLVPLLFLNDDAKYTIGIRLYSYVGGVASGAPRWNRFAAASLVNLAVVGLVLARLKGPLSRAPTAESEQ
ncbi:MAG: ABC transporter permease subunit [Spirochaetaceae bacterium]|nr:ABC transporter permease subunit [Spirochaetaceae bacterium]